MATGLRKVTAAPRRVAACSGDRAAEGYCGTPAVWLHVVATGLREVTAAPNAWLRVVTTGLRKVTAAPRRVAACSGDRAAEGYCGTPPRGCV